MTLCVFSPFYYSCSPLLHFDVEFKYHYKKHG